MFVRSGLRVDIADVQLFYVLIRQRRTPFTMYCFQDMIFKILYRANYFSYWNVKSYWQFHVRSCMFTNFDCSNHKSHDAMSLCKFLFRTLHKVIKKHTKKRSTINLKPGCKAIMHQLMVRYHFNVVRSVLEKVVLVQMRINRHLDMNGG